MNQKFEELGIELTKAELKRIPKKGAFIIISNHPLGGVDGLLLLKLALQQRADFKIIANFLLLKHVFQLEHLHAEDLSFFCNPPPSLSCCFCLLHRLRIFFRKI